MPKKKSFWEWIWLFGGHPFFCPICGVLSGIPSLGGRGGHDDQEGHVGELVVVVMEAAYSSST